MNSSTGDIQKFATADAARKAGYDVPLSDVDAAELMKLTPYERIEQVKQRKEKYPGQNKAYLQGAWQGS